MNEDERQVCLDEAAELGISQPAYEEICTIVGHIPTVDEVSTLLAMWQQSQPNKSLYSWLCGQQHKVILREYIGSENFHNDTKASCASLEPKIKECIDIAHQLSFTLLHDCDYNHEPTHGDTIYLIGDIPRELSGSQYARNILNLHEVITSDSLTNNIDKEYLLLVVDSLKQAGIINAFSTIVDGGLFGTLVSMLGKYGCGFDIIVPREVRADAFLFGERGNLTLTIFSTEQEDNVVSKVSEAQLPCCYLGRVTKGRIVVDSMDFGPMSAFSIAHQPIKQQQPALSVIPAPQIIIYNELLQLCQ